VKAWEAVEHIEPLMHLARAKNLPIFYTESARRADMLDSGVQVGKSHRGGEKTVIEGTHATQTWRRSRRATRHPHRQAQAVVLLSARSS
jgi:hypothetical protein